MDVPAAHYRRDAGAHDRADRGAGNRHRPDAELVQPLHAERPRHALRGAERIDEDGAVGAFHALEGDGFARVDFLVHRDTEEFYINGLNSLPGFTEVCKASPESSLFGSNYKDVYAFIVLILVLGFFPGPVLDVINPVDYSRNNIYDELQDIRIPMWIAQAEYRMGPSESMQDRNIQLVWNFDKFRPHNLGQCGSPNVILDAGCFFRGMANLWDNGGTVANFAPVPPGIALKTPLDNTRPLRGDTRVQSTRLLQVSLPLTDDERPIRQKLWRATDRSYKQASEALTRVRANVESSSR